MIKHGNVSSIPFYAPLKCARSLAILGSCISFATEKVTVETCLINEFDY